MKLIHLPEKAAQRVVCPTLEGSSQALAIAEAALEHDGQCVVITSDTPQAFRLQKEIEFFLNKEITVKLFPDWEILPYDNFSPHQDIISQRISTLYELHKRTRSVVIVPITTVLGRLAPLGFIHQRTFIIKKGETIDREKMRTSLSTNGYRNVPEVLEHGEFAIRGSIIDLFPMGSHQPFRIDLFDDEVDTIRWFDPDSQRSGDTVNTIALLPGREFPTDDDGISLFRQQWRQNFSGSAKDCDIYRQVSDGILPAGIEYYFPLFFEQTASFFDYLPEHTLLFTCGDVQAASDTFWQELRHRYEQYRHDKRRPILPPEALFLKTEDFFSRCKQYTRVIINGPNSHAPHEQLEKLPDLSVDHKNNNPVALLENFIHSSDLPIILCVESAGRRESLMDLLARHQLKAKSYTGWFELLEDPAPLSVVVSPLETGFISKAHKICIVTEYHLFGQRPVVGKRRKKSTAFHENIIRNLAELQPGEAIVHIEQGIGRYKGLQTLDINGQTAEFLTIEYSGEDKLYVPVQSLHLVSRYSAGESSQAPLNKLGSEQWSKARKKAAEKARDAAAELLNIYAKRESKPGFQCPVDRDSYEKFAASFPFEETDDQVNAIQSVLDDLKSAKSMDRLVCGDVGFGKTEVAMRAAFVAAHSGCQVAILVPTTLLAQQHYETLCDRFADWPFSIEVLSRFTQSNKQNTVIESIEAGKTDIVVGTHKLLQGSVRFNSLGLVIIDEEHRFGVKQKESLKALRANVNILALTATPIPRTLNMSMNGIRDLSIIATPPAKRRAIKTFVRPFNSTLIRESILREIMRGGQVYFLHNEVNTIARMAEELNDLLPEASITIAHGQMRERELERVMHDFCHQRYNVLVCTTIIETGIDVPTANTIIMNRADKLGLAQMHQLRGRVGRSHHQAYAYLLTPVDKKPTKDAEKRLVAIEAADDLGAGFTLATHDLEIRGAGELLGDEQSGHIQSIGFNLYMDLLDRAVSALKEGKEPDLDMSLSQHCEVDLKIPAILPEHYIGDVNVRLSLYKRIANSENSRELEEIQIELIDRFGLLPEQAKYLFQTTQLKLAASALGLKKLDVGEASGRVEFEDSTPVDPGALIQLIQKHPNRYRFDGPNRLRFFDDMVDNASRVQAAESMITTLSSL